MKTSNSASSVPFSFCLYIGSLSIFGAGKGSKMDERSIGAYVCSPLVSECPANNIYTKQTGLCFFGKAGKVLGVDAVRNISKIGKSVIGFVAVNVVNAKLGPLPCDVKPRNSVQAVLPVVKPRPHITANGINTSASNVNASGFEFSLEEPSLSVVLKKFADALCGKINLSHAVVPLKQWFGQKPRSVSALAGLRHFNIHWRLL